MSTGRLYFEDPGLHGARAAVADVGRDEHGPFVVLDRTIFHPEGGGQPADTGTVAGVAVLDARDEGPVIRHYLAAELPARPGDVVELRVDAERRFDLSQQHTAQHLLTALLADRHGLPTTSFHLGARFVAIEVDGAVPSIQRLRDFEAEGNALIREDRRVSTRFIEREALSTERVRTRGLPVGQVGPVRLVEIEGVDLTACGGTHVASLRQLQALYLVDAERARGGARLRFVAGSRVLSELRTAAAVEGALKERIGTAPEEFARVLDGWDQSRRRLERRVRDLEGEAAAREGERLADSPATRIAERFPVATPAFLRAVASTVLSRRPDAVVVLMGESAGDPDETACFLVQAGAAGPPDVEDLGRAVQRVLGGKAGGRGRTWQGSGGRVPPALDPRDLVESR